MKLRRPLNAKLTRKLKIHLIMQKAIPIFEKAFALCGFPPHMLALRDNKGFKYYKSKRKMIRDFKATKEEIEAANQFFKEDDCK